jgi:PIN domain nuclease of toxin-antitoxin system
MKILLDTHTFIWFINGDERLPLPARAYIQDVNNQRFLSIASIWEIAIKISLNKLSLHSNFNRIDEFLEANVIELLPITLGHLSPLLDLDFHHRDPFDRVIITQAISENYYILTKDEVFKLYPVKLLWDN